MAALLVVAVACTSNDKSDPTTTPAVTPAATTTVTTATVVSTTTVAATSTTTSTTSTTSTSVEPSSSDAPSTAGPFTPTAEDIAAVKQAVADFWEAYIACFEAPAACDPSAFVASRGPTLATLRTNLAKRSAAGEHLLSDRRGTRFIVTQLGFGASDAATTIECVYDALVFVGQPDENGDPTIVDDERVEHSDLAHVVPRERSLVGWWSATDRSPGRGRPVRLICFAWVVLVLLIGPAGSARAGGTADASDSGVTAGSSQDGDLGGAQSSGPSAVAKVCTEWAQMLPSESLGGAGYAVVFRQGEGGEPQWLWYRTCDGEMEYVWRGGPTPREVAEDLYDEAFAALPKPELSLSGRLDFQIVNAETNVSVVPIAPVSATAEVPGLSVTVTATATTIRLDTGSIVAGDMTRIECEPWGGDGCTWTPSYPSVLKTTGFDDHRYHATVSIVWSVEWTSSVGPGGTLADVTSSSPVLIGVGEIQVIGGR
ncbi:MAG: hypothetical protein QM733_14330 [Ilumatobacteraceae bacterium]